MEVKVVGTSQELDVDVVVDTGEAEEEEAMGAMEWIIILATAVAMADHRLSMVVDMVWNRWRQNLVTDRWHQSREACLTCPRMHTPSNRCRATQSLPVVG